MLLFRWRGLMNLHRNLAAGNCPVGCFIDGTNLKSNDDQHMHQATLTFDGNDHFEAE